MRRTSKRQMRFGFSLNDTLRVGFGCIDPGFTMASVGGVECRLSTLWEERQDLSGGGSLRVRVVSIPESEGDGWLPKGTRRQEEDILLFMRQRNRQPVWVESERFNRRADPAAYEEFAHSHPVGSMIEADVLWVRRNKIGLRLAENIHARMPIGDYVDRLTGWRRMDLFRFPVPDRLEVIIRSIRPERNSVTVSLHGYLQDQKYCDAASGYRRKYDVRNGLFRLLPWDRDDMHEVKYQR
jgi:hypothetical protein